MPTIYYTLDADGAYIWRDARILECSSLESATRMLLADYDPRDWDHTSAKIGFGFWPMDNLTLQQRQTLVVTKINPTNRRNRS